MDKLKEIVLNFDIEHEIIDVKPLGTKSGIAYDRYFALGAVCRRFDSCPVRHGWVAQFGRATS